MNVVYDLFWKQLRFKELLNNDSYVCKQDCVIKRSWTSPTIMNKIFQSKKKESLQFSPTQLSSWFHM